MFNNLKRILIVDDGEDFCILLKNWINFRGLEARTASCARDAIRILETERLNLSFQVKGYGWRFLAFRRSALHWPMEHQCSC